MRVFFSLLKETYNEWSSHKAPKLAAALAYYTVFSIAPLLLLAIGIVSLIFGEEIARREVFTQLGSLVGAPAAETIQQVLTNINRHGDGVLTTVVSSVTLLLGAAGVFGELQDSLDRIWEVQPKPGTGWMGFLKRRVLSFGMILVIGFLLLVSLVATAALSAAFKFLGEFLPGGEGLWGVVSFVVSFGLIACLFAAIYKVLPDAKISWKDSLVGACVTSLLFTIGKSLIGLYLGHTSTASAFGAAGSLVILLIWVYYSSQIVFFGAEFTRVYSNRLGSGLTPKPGAEPAPNSMGQLETKERKLRAVNSKS